MQKTLLVIILFFCAKSLSAQEMYFKTGKNFTNYDFRNSIGETTDLEKGTGNNYELGFNKHFKRANLYYSLSFGLNEYNASGNNYGSYLKWTTDYINVKGAIFCDVFEYKSIYIALKTGLSAENMIYGQQEIDLKVYNLMHQKEFSGLILRPHIGLLYTHSITSETALIFGYELSKGYNLSNRSNEILSIINQSLSFGISLKM